MLYKSTRGKVNSIKSTEAIKLGISPDGGLFVPETDVEFNLENLKKLVHMEYRERAVEILKLFLNDYTENELRECVNKAYTESKFGSNKIAPVQKLNENVYILELWHGPTCAFKDIALQILPHFLVKAVRKLGETSEMVVLVATSGDTGKAALEGFKNVEGTNIIVFYPKEGVSEIQKMQMVTQDGNNVHTIAVLGNFDDTQNGVKSIFTNDEIKNRMDNKSYKFSSANSINWGRLVPQIVYYISAYCDMVKSEYINIGEKVNITVPTGNFGNILAAYYAKNMGLPVKRLICASNENNVLTDFINTGTYDRNRDFKRTVSPSMDILISSNLERLLFEITGHNFGLINKWMDELRKYGIYTVDDNTRNRISNLFWADFTDQKETLSTIECIYNEYKYLVDTHTAVAIDVYDKYVISTNDMTKTIIASTASPFKFNQSVASAVLSKDLVENKNEFELLKILSDECKLEIPVSLKNLNSKEIKHYTVCSHNEMQKKVERILGL